jgi:phosphoribosyl-ATP pyrophosphohydrolase/phosphoribosyl-AMP cyclohydrolase
MKNLDFLVKLEEIIERRKSADPEISYTAKLFRMGKYKIAQKVGEEAVEVSLAAVQENRSEIIAESADLLFHLMVLLLEQNISLTEVAEELRQRHK